MTCRPGKGQPGISQEEARVRAVAETVQLLIQAVKEGRDVDLNVLKCEVSRKHGISRWVGELSLHSCRVTGG